MIAKIRKGDNSVITFDRVLVVALYTFSDDLLSMYLVPCNSLLYFQRYVPDKLNAAKIRKESTSVRKYWP